MGGFCITAPAQMLSLFHHYPCPPARDFGSRVSGLVFLVVLLLLNRPRLDYRVSGLVSIIKCGIEALIYENIQILRSPRNLYVSVRNLYQFNLYQFNKAGYTATEVACGWAGAIFKFTRPFRQQQ